jgi:hypothetical protein
MRRADILAHRGLWTDPGEKNGPAALRAALDMGFGVETDLRDRGGMLVISHDPPGPGEVQAAAAFLAEAARPGRDGLLALNIKADGLQGMVADALETAGIGHDRVVVFDMSVPDGRGYLAAGLPVLSRLSELEPHRTWPERDAGVWLDDFGGLPDQAGLALSLLERGNRVVVVSPELHGRAHIPLWRALRDGGAHRQAGFGLCTDHPLDAVKFFDVVS